tara:strand:+ start:3057 stop:3971 length:915 start_codon:yes stop_codon:yes gene_type:complete
MKITNKHNLPAPVVAALSFDSYDRGKSNRSITQLIDSPKVSILKREHDPEISEDVSNKLWSVLGTAVHIMFENSTDDENMISEERYFFTHPEGWTISGAIDLQVMDQKSQSITVMDYKCTSVWSVIFDKKEWHNQLNAYAWLLRKRSIAKDEVVCDWPVTKLQVVAVLKDWKQNELKRSSGNYPKAPIVIIDIPLWSNEKQDEYMESRIKLHSDAEFAYLTGQSLPDCSPVEQWAKGAKYAVHKGMAKRAARVFDSQKEANDWVLGQSDSKGLSVVTRQGEKTRCTADWCNVNQWCDQYRRESV